MYTNINNILIEIKVITMIIMTIIIITVIIIMIKNKG